MLSGKASDIGRHGLAVIFPRARRSEMFMKPHRRVIKIFREVYAVVQHEYLGTCEGLDSTAGNS